MVIKAVADYVRNIQDTTDLDAIAKDVFQHSQVEGRPLGGALCDSMWACRGWRGTCWLSKLSLLAVRGGGGAEW